MEQEPPKVEFPTHRKIFFNFPTGLSPLMQMLPKPKPLTKRQIANAEIRALKQRLKDALDVLNGKKIAVDPDSLE